MMRTFVKVMTRTIVRAMMRTIAMVAMIRGKKRGQIEDNNEDNTDTRTYHIPGLR